MRWLATWIDRWYRGNQSTGSGKRRAQGVSLTCEQLEPRIGPAVVAPVHTFQNPDTSVADRNYAFGYFGSAVAMSDSDVLIGAPQANGGVGAAYLYDLAGHLLHTFTDPNGPQGAFGGQVALFGAHVLIGAPAENNGAGAAYLFDTSGKLLATFHDPNAADKAEFGAELALSNANVLIGAPAPNGGTCAAYLFTASGQLLQTIPVSNTALAVWGNWVALSGANFLVGSQDTNNDAGVVYLYSTSGQLLHTFVTPAGPHEIFFGTSVALSGSEVAVGMVGNLGGTGAVYLYNTAGQMLQTINEPAGANENASFGSSVALSGNDVLVGARGSNGAAYLYNTAGQLLETFQAPQGVSGDGFGQAVALSGAHALVSADDAVNNFTFPGAVYLYNIPAQPTILPILATGSAWLPVQMPPQQLVISSVKDLLAATGLNESQLASLLNVPAIDWTTQMVVLVSSGFGELGAWSAQANITGLTVVGNTLTASWEWDVPNRDQIFPQFIVLANSFDLVLVNRFAGPVNFQIDGPAPLSALLQAESQSVGGA
jgi:hypothetical protein